MPFWPRLSHRALATLAVLGISLGVLLLVASGIVWLAEHRIDRTRQVTTGTITEYVPHEDRTGRVLFYPRIRFRTPDSTIHQFLGPDGTNPAPFTAGGTVQVFYPSGHPEAARMTTGSPRHPVGRPLCIAGIAVFDVGCLFWIAHFLRRRKHHKRARHNPAL